MIPEIIIPTCHIGMFVDVYFLYAVFSSLVALFINMDKL